MHDETSVETVQNEPAVGTPTGCTSSRAAALFGGEKVVVEDCFRTEKDEFFCAAAGSTEGVSSGRPSGGQPRCSKAARVKASTSPGQKRHEEENESSQFIFVESEVDLTNICMVCFKEIGEELGKVINKNLRSFHR